MRPSRVSGGGTVVALLWCFLCLQGRAAWAEVLTFDDARQDSGVIPQGYGGFTWTNFLVWDSTNETVHFSQCLTSGDFFAFYGTGKTATLSRSNFDFMDVNLAAMWSNFMHVAVKGYRENVELYSADVIVHVDTSVSRHFDFNFQNIDSLSFYSYGGYDSANTQLGMDDLTFQSVPEPGTLALLALGGLGVIGRAGRRRWQAG